MKSTKATIGLQPSGDDAESYFFMGMAGKGAGFTPSRPVFDSENVTGQKEKLIVDDDLGEFVECSGFLAARAQRGPSPGALIWRTENEVSTAKETKFVDVKLKAKRNSNDQAGFVGIIISGEWVDDGDGVPEDPDTSDDEIDCTGESTTSFLMKGNPVR